MTDRTRRARPSLEGLEGRQLLAASKGGAVHALATGPATITAQSDNLFAYTTADGAKVRVRLIGPGSLAGTALDGNGNLNLVFSGSGVFTQILGTVKGGSGRAALGTIRNANVPLNSLTGVGGELIGRISLPDFDLVSGGNVNLLAGVNELTLDSVAANSQMHLRDTPLNTTLGISTTVDPLTGAGLGYAGNQPYRSISTSNSSVSGTTGQTTTASGANGTTTVGAAVTGLSGVQNPGTLDPTVTGFGSTAVGAINGAIPIINTIGNGQNVRGTPGLTQSQVSSGRSLTYAFESTTSNAIRLNSVAGTFTPGANLIEPRDVSLSGYNHVPPPGVILRINSVNGTTMAGTAATPLGNPNIYGYDPATSRLIRFDATTGGVLGTINVPAAARADGFGGVALARNGTELVALVGAGNTVYAYDAVSGVAVGQFTTQRNIAGIATTSAGTALIDPSGGTTGLAQVINVPASLAAGTSVTTGSVFLPAREFQLGGGATGVAGRDAIYALGTGFLDTSQPNLTQAGIVALGIAPGGTISESTRTALSSNGISVPGTAGAITGDNSRALGSIESNLALDVGVTNGQNVLALLNPVSLTALSTVSLNYPNPLSDLSESFHPELTGTALIDVQGNVQLFEARSVNGLVLNDAGNLNRFDAKTATNSSIVGLPFGHVSIKNRSNVSIVTNARLVGDRGDVTVVPTARPVGPLVLP